MFRVTRSAADRRFRRVRFWAFAVLGLVIGHDAVFIAEYGPASARALANTGHGYWYTFAILAVLLVGVPIVGACVGIARLWTRVTVARRGGRLTRRALERREPGPGYLDEFLGLAPRLFAAITAGFLVQENLEHLAVGHGLHGLDVLLWPYHPLALPVLFGVSVVLALAAAWLRWRQAVLERCLSTARAREAVRHSHDSARAAPTWGIVAAAIALQWLVARRLAGRAPPRTGPVAA